MWKERYKKLNSQKNLSKYLKGYVTLSTELLHISDRFHPNFKKNVDCKSYRVRAGKMGGGSADARGGRDQLMEMNTTKTYVWESHNHYCIISTC